MVGFRASAARLKQGRLGSKIDAAVQERLTKVRASWAEAKTVAVLVAGGIQYRPSPGRLLNLVPHALQKQLAPGDVLLRRTEGSSANWFIPGRWTHAAMYAGRGLVVEGGMPEMYSLEEFLKQGDELKVLRHLSLGPAERRKVVDFAKAQIGKPYNYDFDFYDDTRFSCTQLVNSAYRTVLHHDLAPLTVKNYLTPEDFETKDFSTVFSTEK